MIADEPHWTSRAVDICGGAILFATLLCIPSAIGWLWEHVDLAWTAKAYATAFMVQLFILLAAAAVVWLVRPRDEA